jgi:hypothetical protein
MKKYILITLFILLSSFSISKAEVIGTSTSLIWQDNATSTVMSWDNAIGYCDDLDYDNYTNWRLPKISELTFELSNQFLLLSGSGFEEYLFYWSESEYDVDNSHAGFSNFGFVYTLYDTNTNENYTRCVRDVITEFNCESSTTTSELFVGGFSYGSILTILFLIFIFTLLFFKTLKDYI